MQNVSLSLTWKPTAEHITDEARGLIATVSLETESQWRWSVQRGTLRLDVGHEASQALAREAALRALARIGENLRDILAHREAGLVCPACGYFGQRPRAEGADGPFRIVSDYVGRREIAHVGSGTIVGRPYYEADPRDEGRNHRLECGACRAEFPIPRMLTLDWI